MNKTDKLLTRWACDFPRETNQYLIMQKGLDLLEAYDKLKDEPQLTTYTELKKFIANKSTQAGASTFSYEKGLNDMAEFLGGEINKLKAMNEPQPEANRLTEAKVDIFEAVDYFAKTHLGGYSGRALQGRKDMLTDFAKALTGKDN